MADLTNGSGVFQTYNNAGTGVAELGDNKAAGLSNGLGPRTILIKIAKSNMTTAELGTALDAIQAGGVYSGSNSNDAFTIAGVSSDGGDTPGAGYTDFVSGESDVVFVLAQGTGDFVVDASNALGVTGATTTVEAVFTQDTSAPDTGITVAAEQSGNF